MMSGPEARQTVKDLRASAIREIANAGMDRTDILPFWFGESDQPTPEFIREAAAAALDEKLTFYTQNLGRSWLRRAIAEYSSALHGIALGDERIAVTGSGVSAIMLAAQVLLSPGDRVVAVTPLWPNITEIPKILGAEVVRHPLVVENGRWRLDAGALIAKLTPGTRLLIINSPSNPTGWTITADDQSAILEHCRRHGIWILADEVYERLIFRPGLRAAPSFLALAEPDERLVVVNSFSKSWRMTGWRVGWLTVPEAITGDLAKVIEYNTSCVSDFVQRGALAAVSDPRGEETVRQQRAALLAARQRLRDGLTALDGVSLPETDGAMYAFFRIAGHEDVVTFCKQLIAEEGLGLAPGVAFGPEGDGYIRWCFAAGIEKIDDGLARLRRFLSRHPARTG
jgi:aspartate/methionine/tyrosine aminotransferase